MLFVPIIVSIFSLVFVYFLIREINRAPAGSEKMVQISQTIEQGARVFLKKEFKVLAIVLFLTAVILALLISPGLSLVFLFGAIISSLTGVLGMKTATQANVRVANSALGNFFQSFKIAFSSGAVMGILVVSCGLLGLALLYLIFPKSQELLLGYAFGASLVALFLRAGGGIYTKSADIGADLAGKIEKGIPEDDSRNPAVIADAVGDNVGDVAGMGSDLFESYVSAIIAVMLISWFLGLGAAGLALPMFLAGAGIICSIIGIIFVLGSCFNKKKKFQRDSSEEEGKVFQEQTESIRIIMNKGVIISNLLMVIAAYFIINNFIGEIGIFYSLLSGMAVGFLIGKSTEYFTSDKCSPVLNIAKSSQTGASTNIIEGLSVGMLSVLPSALAIILTTILAYHFGGFYGITMAALGVLVVLGINLSMDCYGPVADNAGSIVQMAGLSSEARKKTDVLDSVGNTTAAMGKGFAIGSAVLAALAWLVVFYNKAGLEVISLVDPKTIAGLFIGATLPFIFCSLTMKAVGQGGLKVVEEVRRQFREIPNLMEDKSVPDYKRCIDIATKESLKKMLVPGVLTLLAPIFVGYFIGLESLGALMIGSLITGFLLAIMMANAGGAWDNAKKYIEAGNLGGKGSEIHKAAIVGDTVGDPFKDTAGPSLNILIKLIGIVSLIFLMAFL